MRDDFGVDVSTAIAKLINHPLVEAFIEKRADEPRSGKTVGPAAANRTISHLGAGSDHRGATFYDEREAVIWLCAAGRHRSGEPTDAFPYFHRLLEDGELYPDDSDYASLFEERERTLFERIYTDAQALLERCRGQLDVEQQGVLGGDLPVGIVVNVVETLEETSIVLSYQEPRVAARVITILAAFFPDDNFDQWEVRDRLPTRALDPREVCFTILHG